jgi:glutamyl-tRNA reductase
VLTFVGTSHHLAPIEAREQLAIPGEALPDVLAQLGERFGAGTLVNTCNRMEVYLSGKHSRREVLDFLAGACGADRELVERACMDLYDTEAVRHLYSVAAGVDSMVLGEYEVLGQVRAAFSAAVNAGTDDALLSRLFHTAIRTGRRARAETEIGHHAVSVSSIAVQQARVLFPELEHATVLVIGAGEAGRLAASALVDHGVREVLVVNRTASRAESLAAELGGRALPLDDLARALAQADIAIAAADTPEPLVSRDAVEHAMADRAGRALLIIDIGMPRDCDPAVGDVDGVTYYDLDDLQAIAAEHRAARANELDRVQAIVDEEAARFVQWWEQLQVIPTITALTDRAEQVRATEVAKSLRRLRLSEEQQSQLDLLTKAIVKQLLHDPITALRDRGDSEDYVDAARRLFRLDERVRRARGRDEIDANEDEA